MVNYKREQLARQIKEKEKELKAEKDRVQKQKNFAKFMRRKLNQNLKKSSSLHNMTESKITKLQSDWKKLKKQNEEDLCKIYYNVMSRPFLFESNKI